MSNLLSALAIPILRLAAASLTNPLTGRNWDVDLLPACEELIPPPLQSQHGLKPLPAEEDYDSSNTTFCPFEHASKNVSLFYQCGLKLAEKGNKVGDGPTSGYVHLPGVGKLRGAEVDKVGDTVYLRAYDEDTPCEVRLKWPDAAGGDAAKQLMKDLLVAATPAVVGKPRLVAIYLDPKSAPGRALVTSPDAWKKESAGLDGYMSLAAGYPKLLDGKSLPGLPDEKVGVLGLCAIGGDGEALSADIALPGVHRVLVDAPHSAASCPAVTQERTWWDYEGTPEVKLGDRTLTMTFYYDAGVGGRRKTRARAYLREADGSLISFAADELLFGDEREDLCKATLKKNKSGATFKAHCLRDTPDHCKKKPWWSFTQTIRVSGDQVTIGHDEKTDPGVDCEGGDYE